MPLWGKTDVLASVPKYETPKVENALTFDGSSGSVVDTTNDKIISVGHGFVTGDIVQYSDGGGTAITPLVDGTSYFVIRLDDDEFQLALTGADAAGGTEIALTAVGVGSTHSVTRSTNEVFFVDETEAGVAANRAKGLKTPGWNKYVTYVDSDGNTRHRVETLVAIRETAANAGDDGVTGQSAIEDETVADS